LALKLHRIIPDSHISTC